jgi:hypothetical protein
VTTATVAKPPPIHLSMSVRRFLVDQFDADTLRQLAALKEAESPRRVARRCLSEAKRDELAEMLTLGRRPTIGWYRRAF